MRLLTVLLLLALLAGPALASDTLPGLQGRAEVLRDEWGVPHIYASTSHDLFFMQGYVQAQDRWWQMNWWRHLGHGRLGELAGRELLAADISTRTLGGTSVVARELEELDADTIANLEAFAAGVNAYLTTREAATFNEVALGLAGMDLNTAPWTPADTLIWGKVMAYNLGGNMGIEMLLSALAAQLTPEMIAAYAPPFPYDQRPTILLPEDLDLPARTSQSAPPVLAGPLPGISAPTATELLPATASNNWVVGRDLSASGAPLLANDPHLSVQMPAIWLRVGLHCQPVSEDCPYNVVGFTFAPTPGVVIGHNGRIAWGVTNAGPDVQDLYQIRVNPDNPAQYEWNGDWRDMTIRDETITFADGAESVTIQVRDTHLGPIINDNALVDGSVQGFTTATPLALRWTGLETGTLFQSVLKLNRAQNWDEFRDALRDWDAPSQNFVYADVDGNIGYQMPGRIPIRAGDHNGLTPVPGWTDAYEWRGYIPFDNLPSVLNPTRDFIASANQPIVPPAYSDYLAAALGDTYGTDSNYAFGYYFAYGYRGQRIHTLIDQLAPHTPDTFRQIQGDNYNIGAAELMPYLAALALTDADLSAVRDWLLDWDFQMHMDSGPAALYALFWSRVMDNLFNDELAPVTRAGGNDNHPWAVRLLADDPQHRWWDDITTPDTTETRDDILIRSLAEAYAEAVAFWGDDRDTWRWGDLHTTTFVSDPVGRSGVTLAENAVNRGPIATSGDSNVVNAAGWNAASGHFRVNSHPSMRMIVDLGDLDNSRAVLPTGQSGDPFSPHYDDTMLDWRDITDQPMLWSRGRVESAAVSRQVFSGE